MQLYERQLEDIESQLRDGGPSVDRDQEIFADFQRYERQLEEERVERRHAQIRELTEANREQAFVALLRQSAETPAPSMTFEEWLPWWQNLPEAERQDFERRMQEAKGKPE